MAPVTSDLHDLKNRVVHLENNPSSGGSSKDAVIDHLQKQLEKLDLAKKRAVFHRAVSWGTTSGVNRGPLIVRGKSRCPPSGRKKEPQSLAAHRCIYLRNGHNQCGMAIRLRISIVPTDVIIRLRYRMSKSPPDDFSAWLL